MGAHGPRIEEMATRRLRHLEPGLASDWDEQQEEQRRTVALQRKKEIEQRQQSAAPETLGTANTLILQSHQVLKQRRLDHRRRLDLEYSLGFYRRRLRQKAPLNATQPKARRPPLPS